MRVYVASKFENTKAVREAQAALKDDGHIISHDWTFENAEALAGSALEAYLQGCAERDMEGVINADALLLINYTGCAGAYVELGMALASGRFVVVIDGHHPEKPRNIFFHLAHVHHAKDLEDARKILLAHELFLHQGAEVHGEAE